MGNQLSKKQKRALLVTGITGAVYLSFKYLLPLVIPFLISYLIALGIRPLARWLSKKLHIKESITSIALVIIIVGSLSFLIWFVGKQLILQMVKLIEYLPEYVEELHSKMGSFCSKMEKTFSLEEGVMMDTVYEASISLAEGVRQKALPFLMSRSIPIFKGVMQVAAVIIVTIIGVFLSLKEMDHFKRMKARSSFRTEITLVTRRLSVVGGAYVKTQGMIMGLTMAICVGGFTVMGNSYSVLLGIVIGLLDALPIFGTGTVLIPWALINVLSGNMLHAFILCAILVICNFLREILEARLMGKSMGISALESLAAMYIGLQLFGIAGFILGPVGFLVIRELTAIYSQ